MKQSARWPLLAGVVALTVISAAGSIGDPGQARAGPPQCLAEATDPCPVQAQAPHVDPPRPRVQIYCRPAGPKWGAHCYRRVVP